MILCEMFEDSIKNVENIRDLYAIITIFQTENRKLLNDINQKLDRLLLKKED